MRRWPMIPAAMTFHLHEDVDATVGGAEQPGALATRGHALWSS